ncbi:MAG: PEPxxWA-CTERM sorting domain-containing protein [Sphingomonas sp.]
MTIFKSIVVTVASGLAVAAIPAYAQTTVSYTSGPGSAGALNTAPAGTQAAPWTLSESITGIAPLVISFNNPQTEPVGPTNSAGGSFAYGKWIALTITNNSGFAWNAFDLELQSVLGTASTDGDGLSFAQGQNFPFTSNRFSSLHRTEDVRDFLNFDGGSVAIGQSVTFNFAITDNVLRNQFWLSQTPNRVVGGVPEPTTWAMMLLGFGGMGVALRRRPKVAARIRFA